MLLWTTKDIYRIYFQIISRKLRRNVYRSVHLKTRFYVSIDADDALFTNNFIALISSAYFSLYRSRRCVHKADDTFTKQTICLNMSTRYC